MTEHSFTGADILLPKKDFEKWAVIACDQFTSEQDYWDETDRIVGDAPSALRITLPEIYLEKPDVEERIRKINDTMKEYLATGVLESHPDTMVYVERTQSDGTVRHGIVGSIRLEDYDYKKGSHALVRATTSRISLKWAECSSVCRLHPRLLWSRRFRLSPYRTSPGITARSLYL